MATQFGGRPHLACLAHPLAGGRAGIRPAPAVMGPRCARPLAARSA